MRLDSLLPPSAVLSRLQADDKKHALRLLSAHASTLTGLGEKDIYTVLLDREQVGCTGMGNGVCIPHGRYEQLKTSHAIFARLAKPIEFGAADGKRVDLLFLLLTPASANTEHLKALATVSKLLRDKRLCENLRTTHDAKIMHTLLLSAAEDTD